MNKVNEIMEIMNSINYGFLDEQGKNIFENDYNDEFAFSRKYYLISPEELLNKKYGVCWDQVELERKLFEDNNINISTYFIYIDNKSSLPSHTFLVINKNNKFYWFEHSWEDQRGIHEYNLLNDLLNDVEEKFIKSEEKESNRNYKSYIYKYNKPKFNINCDQFYEFIYTQEKVYNYKLIDASDDDIDRLKEYKLKNIIDYADHLETDEINQINSYVNESVLKQINNYKNIIYNTKIVGSILTYTDNNAVLIDEIFIEEKYRNKGIGTSLIKNIISTSNQNIYLWVYKNNNKAFELYKSIGFCIKDETSTRYYMEFLK